LEPPSSSRLAPTARSGMPSPSRSPRPATIDAPNWSLSSSSPTVRPPGELIFCSALTVPSGFRNRMWTAPRLVPPSSSACAPTAMSGMPSPSRSPIPATPMPKKSLSSRVR
jgi:hypothetical protein